MVDFAPSTHTNFVSQVMSVTFMKIKLCHNSENTRDIVKVTGQANHNNRVHCSL